MIENNCRIICASAGTGKTYRLSLEYLALILKYYGKSEFSLDNILVLTFTRKATAEIRERIIKHLELLLSDNVEDMDEQNILLNNLRELMEERFVPLSEIEKNMLLSARKELICDQSHLQVMTIDSYTGQIFRNIVRPICNIEHYDIDTEAIIKIMPLLFKHLMKPIFRESLQDLLSKKVSRSLDDYTSFFRSLIEQRWLYYLITKRKSTRDSSSNGILMNLDPDADSTEYYGNFLNAMQELIQIVVNICAEKNEASLADYFNKEFKQLVNIESNTINAIYIMDNLKRLDLDAAEKLLTILDKSNIWNKQKISAKKYTVENTELQNAQDMAKLFLADYLILKLYIPEQKQILGIWSDVLKEYDRLIYRYKNLTYNDITWLTFEALFSNEPPFLNPQSADSATEFYQFLTHRTRFLLIDEFQDTSLIQFNVLKPIIEEITAGEGSKPFGGVIVVGDEKQSIFGWRGGERDLLLNLKDIFPALKEVKMESLKQSFRCGPTLMEFINQVFSNSALHQLLQEKEMQWNYARIESQEYKKEEGSEIEFCLRNLSKSADNTNKEKDIYQDFIECMVIPALRKDETGSIAILCRTNNELTKIQHVLDEYKITSLYQPNSSIIEHHYVAPLLSWLRFQAWGDWMDFIAFLRSDYVLINTKVLKQTLAIIARTLELQKEWEKPILPDFSALPIINTLFQLSLQQQGKKATEICRDLIDFCLPSKQLSERDYLNLQRFLDILATRMLTDPEKGTSFPDLLAYFKENANSENFQQVSVNISDSLQLLTFHKSKGLQFKRVFVFYNFYGKHRDTSDTISWALSYEDKTFNKIRDYGISLHYQKIMKLSSYAPLYLQEQKREQLEEMNNLYVAITRAEQKLHLYFGFQYKEGWDAYYDKYKSESLPVAICNAVQEIFMKSTPDERGVYVQKSMFELCEKDKTEKSERSKAIREQINSSIKICHHRPFDPANYLPAEVPDIKDLKKYYLIERPNLIGDLLHFYMSFIIRNELKEHQYALYRCLNRYGAIFTGSQIDNFAARCKQVCEHNPYLFTTRWNEIFTEQEIVENSKIFRIDRLMINTAEKESLIIDYKSGDIHDPKQLINYKNALLKLPALQNYQIDTKIVPL